MSKEAIILVAALLVCSCQERKSVTEADAIAIATRAVSEKYPRVKVSPEQALPYEMEDVWMVRWMPVRPATYPMIVIIVRKSDGKVITTNATPIG